MPITVDTVTAPAFWASALVNDDYSGLTEEEAAAVKAWLANIAPAYVVDIARDAEGDADEPRFTWHYRLHGGDAEGGDVLDYITHQIGE